MFEIVTLPATGETAVTGYTVAITGKMDGRETLAFSGNLMRGDVLAGIVKNDGLGGETTVGFTSEDEEALFADYVAKWTFGWTVANSPVMAHTFETVVDALAYETIINEERTVKA